MADYNGMYEVCRFCGKLIKKGTDRCPYCGNPSLDSLYPDEDERGRKGKWKMDTKHCHKCQERYKEPEDQYCRYCGAKRKDQPARYFEVSPEYIECIYGPMPVQIGYVCCKCHYQWTGSSWDEEFYCPKCGCSLSEGKPVGPWNMISGK